MKAFSRLGFFFSAGLRVGDGGSMAGESVWVVTWLPLSIGVRGHKRKARSPEHKEFDDLTNAVCFVMGLDESVQRTATIRLPGDDAIGLANIKKMHAAQESARKLGSPNVA
jgi:hypothetical protein